MFDDLKTKIMSEDFKKIKEKLNEFDESDYHEEILQHKFTLKIREDYEDKMTKIKQQTCKQNDLLIKANQKIQKLQMQIELLKKQHQRQIQYNNDQQKREIAYYNNQISRLTEVSMHYKGFREHSTKQKQLVNINYQLQQKIEEQIKIIQDLDTKFSLLLDEKHENIQNLLKFKQEYQLYRGRTQNQMLSLKQKNMKLQIDSKQISSKYKNIKEAYQKQLQITHKTQVLMHETEEGLNKNLQEVRNMLQARIEKLENENKELRAHQIRNESDTFYKDKIIKKYQEDIKQLKSKSFYEISRPLISDKKISSSRIQDPENTFTNNKKQVKRQVPKLNIQNNDHHCKCLKAERYRAKLKEANDKIMQLLTQKCRNKIQMAHYLKKGNALKGELTMLEVTDDLQNIILL